MGKSTSGPDWTDVAMLMSAIGSLHGCQVVLCVTADSQGHNGQLAILAEARFELLPGSSLPRVISIREGFPSNRGATMGEMCYNAVWQLDHQISKEYEAMPLFPEA
jgi:hypothetical protein